MIRLQATRRLGSKAFAGTLLVLVFFTLSSGCHSNGPYFGTVKKPSARRLVWENQGEPGSLDPQLMLTLEEGFIADALYGSLVRFHPITLDPTADIATHYERNPQATRYVFYLRGHPHPRGIRLPNTDDMREQYRSGRISEDLARGHAAPNDLLPARWSDGRPITASDFVYSWRRLFNPKTASPNAQPAAYILNSAEILAGKRKPEELGVRALDDWTLEVLLSRPTEFFLDLLDFWGLFAVPRQAIEAAEARGAPDSWTDPKYIVTSGPFRLAEWRPYENITVRRNPDYWEADLVGLDEIVFLPIEDNLTNLNLYKAGGADMMLRLPPAYIPTLKKMRDHETVEVQGVYYLQCNTREPPLDNVLVRYALNMATEKRQVAKVFNGNQTPARTYVVPLSGYQPPSAVPVMIDGRTYDVSSYDPKAARELLALAGYPKGLQKSGRPLRVDYSYTAEYPMAEDLVETLRVQWRENLGIELVATKLESALFFAISARGEYRGLAQSNSTSLGAEPVTYMDLFFYTEQAGGMFWQPEVFARLVSETKATVGRVARLKRLGECDRMVMEGMPVIPLVFDWRDYMFKPYVRGLPLNSVVDFRFKYGWVEN